MSVYNGEQYLDDAIKSILNQTYCYFEFIIINDGSTDNSLSIIERFAGLDERIVIINQKNHGLVYSLNKGCGFARGHFIARMDADDISLPTRLEKQLQAFSAEPELGLVGTYFSYINLLSEPSGTCITMPTKDVDIRRALYVVNPFAHGSTMFKKSAWQAAGGYSSSCGPVEDYDLWKRFANSADSKMAIIPDVLYLYRINPDGISQQKTKEQAVCAKRVVDELWDGPYLGKGIRETVRDGIYYGRVHHLLSEGVFGTYYNQQILIMTRLFQHRHFLTGFKLAIAIFLMNPRRNRALLVRSVMGGFARKVGLKK